jgi:Na+/H+ antiporter
MVPEGGIHLTELILVTLVAFVAILAAFAQRVKMPYPIVLVLGGLALSFVPVFPNISLRPDFVFLVILPPLLYTSALQTSWSGFRYNMVSIAMLAFGLVAFTVAGVAVAAHMFIPGFDWQSGALLGAVVCTTDAIAIAAIAKRVGLPHFLLEIIEGESLMNDATGLLALQFSVALVASGTVPSVWEGAGKLLFLVVGGVLTGLLVGWTIHLFQRPGQGSSLQTMVSLATPYFAYLLGEGMHTSGVLATVVCGLYLGRQSSKTTTSETRLELQSVWKTVEFVLNGVVFILIGLQFPLVLHGMRPYNWPDLLGTAAFVSLLLIGLRMIWMYPGSRIAWLIRHKLLKQKMAAPNNRQLAVLGWSGLRGVLTLAAALSLPEATESGAAFPHRATIIFLAFSVILVTLVGQGLTLPWLTRRLGVCAPSGTSEEENGARRALATAAMNRLEQMLHEVDDSDESAKARYTMKLLQDSYQRRLEALEEADASESRSAGKTLLDLNLYTEFSGKVRETERSELYRLQSTGAIGDGTARKLERELDLLELRFPSK